MEYSFKPEVWHQVFVILGSSSAGLIGLLFIAASLQVKAIASNPVFYRRAFLFPADHINPVAVGSHSAADSNPRSRTGCH